MDDNTPIYMPFGKHRGMALTLIPEDYLEWLTRLPDLPLWLHRAVECELEARSTARHQRQTPPRATVRGVCPDPALASDIVSNGLRQLARRHHPDAGGDHETMVRLNNCADWLLARLRGQDR